MIPVAQNKSSLFWFKFRPPELKTKRNKRMKSVSSPWLGSYFTLPKFHIVPFKRTLTEQNIRFSYFSPLTQTNVLVAMLLSTILKRVLLHRFSKNILMKLKAIFSFHNARYYRKTGMRAATANSLGSHNYVQRISENVRLTGGSHFRICMRKS